MKSTYGISLSIALLSCSCVVNAMERNQNDQQVAIFKRLGAQPSRVRTATNKKRIEDIEKDISSLADRVLSGNMDTLTAQLCFEEAYRTAANCVNKLDTDHETLGALDEFVTASRNSLWSLVVDSNVTLEQLLSAYRMFVNHVNANKNIPGYAESNAWNGSSELYTEDRDLITQLANRIDLMTKTSPNNVETNPLTESVMVAATSAKIPPAPPMPDFSQKTSTMPVPTNTTDSIDDLNLNQLFEQAIEEERKNEDKKQNTSFFGFWKK